MIETGAMMGGEESGGYGFGMHLPERDGIYADLLLLDLFIREREAGRWPVSRAVAHLHEVAGPSFYLREDVHARSSRLPGAQGATPAASSGEPAPPTLGGRTVDARRSRSTRVTASSSGSTTARWLLIRFSGTEPLVRVYTEATSAELRDALLADGRAMVGPA